MAVESGKGMNWEIIKNKRTQLTWAMKTRVVKYNKTNFVWSDVYGIVILVILISESQFVDYWEE